MGPLDALLSANGDRLDVLGAEHRAAAAAAGVTAIVRNRRVANEMLAGRTDRRDAVVSAEVGSNARLGVLTTGAAILRR